MGGTQTYKNVPVPILAIYVAPIMRRRSSRNRRRAAFEAHVSTCLKQWRSVGKRAASARVVQSLRANHYLFLSNEADVLREVRAFLFSLPTVDLK